MNDGQVAGDAGAAAQLTQAPAPSQIPPAPRRALTQAQAALRLFRSLAKLCEELEAADLPGRVHAAAAETRADALELANSIEADIGGVAS